MATTQKKLRIANFVTDEKFVDSAIQLLSLTPGRSLHDFFFCPYWKIDFHYLWKLEFKYIKSKQFVKIVSKKDILSVLESGSYDAVILHSLDSMPYDVISKIPAKVKVLWFAWGYDLYGHHGKKVIEIEQYKPLTKNAIKLDTIPLKLKSSLKSLLDLEQDKLYASAVSRVDYFSGCLPNEYQLCLPCSYFKAKQVDFRYQGAKEFVKKADFSSGRNILIGNSANPTGNHLDILPYFDGIDIGERKVFVPLSYSGADYYVKKVKDAYFKRFGKNCVFLDGFMPVQEYNKLRDECSVGIFFHERQQSLGNINFMLKRGAKVFLSESSIAFNYYKLQKCSIFSLQNDFSQQALDKPLSDNEKMQNLDFIAESRSLCAKIKRLNDMYDAIEMV
ncbi:MAG: TDP-N-acetylfucosamine:lipid II N-acetylfucosaminyltransferase [Fibrobacter sp.]|nr:TDP-N-acetylfucosamine:lipid II N-acetylfucosaminyltransferase [Fibrobacter sp.]